MPRPRFSLLSLLLFSLACAAGMGVYWRSAAWVIEREIPRATDSDIFGAVLSPDGQYIVVQVEAKQIECYSIDGRRLWGPVPASLLDVKISPDSRRVFAEVRDSNSTRVLDLKTGRVEQFIATRGFASPILSPNGNHLFHSGFGFTLWHMQNGRMITELESAPSPCFPPDEFVRSQRRARVAALKELPTAKDFVSYCEILRGPPESHFPNDIEKESKAALDRDDPEVYLPDRPFFYPFAVNGAARVSADGSRIVTAVSPDPDSPGGRTSMTLWSGDTLERLADFKIPDNFYIHALSPKGDTALLMGLQSAELCLLTVPEGRELFRTEARQGWLHVEDYTGFTADGAYLYESLQRPVKGSDGTTQFRSRIHRRSDGKLISDVPDIFRPTMTFPDMRRVLVDSGTVGDLETSKELFDFERTADEESTSYEVLDIFPDNEHVLTVGKNHSMLVWKRVRPEWWWGHFWLWETYVLIGFSVAFLWSLLRRERPTFV